MKTKNKRKIDLSNMLQRSVFYPQEDGTTLECVVLDRMTMKERKERQDLLKKVTDLYFAGDECRNELRETLADLYYT